MQDNEQKLQILLIDDDEEEYYLLKEMIRVFPAGARPLSCTLDWVSTYEEAVAEIDRKHHDVYLVDYHLGGHNGLEVLRYAISSGCSAPVIMLTGQGNYEIDLAAMQEGAADYLVKDQLTLPLLERAIRYALEHQQVRAELERLVQERTQKLADANQELKNEIIRRQEAEEFIRQSRDELERKVAERTMQLQARAEELQALHNATATLLTTLDLHELLSQTINAVQSAIPAAEKGWLYLLAPDTGRLHLQAVSTFRNARLQTVRFATDQEYSAQVVVEQQPLIIYDTFDPAAPEHEEKGMPGAIRSIISAPLVVGSQSIGALSLGSSHPNVFNEANLNVLVSFAATTTSAIQNAMLHGEIQKLATVDPLTGLYNRRAFVELGEREVDRFNRFGHPLSVVMFDLDHFKPVNDTYGHLTGDQVLHALATRFRANIRQSDIMSRFGGDEFALLLPETDMITASEIADRICLAVHNTPIQTDAGAIFLTISMGVITASYETSDLATLLARADAALYRAKQNGRGRVEAG